jgi:hypothetical protein
VRRERIFTLAAVEVARQQVSTPMCGTPCHARPYHAPSPGKGLKVKTYRTKVQYLRDQSPIVLRRLRL